MTTMSRASPAPARGQSILVHVRKVADTTESQNQSTWKAGLPEVNAWFIIRDTAIGPKMSEIFGNLPENKPVHSVVVGSHLYDIGGCGSKPNGEDYFSNQIRHLDTNNPNGGWKSEELPVYCTNPTTAVFGEFIYLFPNRQRFTTLEELENGANPEAPRPWAYVYDTIQKKAFELKLPDGCVRTSVSFCASLEGRGVLVPIEGQENGGPVLYLHKPKDMMWEKSDSPPFTEICNSNHYAVLNGILYVYCTRNDAAILKIYDFRTEYLPTIKLPTFDDMEKKYHKWDTFIVPVANSELCFLWHKRPYWYKDLYYAKVSVDPLARTATLLKQAVLRIDALEVINCLPYASLSDDHNEEAEVYEIADHCMYLEEELDWAAKEIQKVRERMKRAYGILPPVLLSESGSSWGMRPNSMKQEFNEVLCKGLCLYMEEELHWVEEEVQRVQKRLKKAYSTLPPELQVCDRKKGNKQDHEDEFWNTRLEQYAAFFQHVNSSATVLDILLQGRNTFTQIPSDR